MEKRKRSNRTLLYYIPFAMQLIIHFVASAGFTYSTPDNFILRIIRGVLITVIAMAAGEGYGSIAFIVAGYYDRIGAYIAVITFSVISAVANLAGYMFSGIEGLDCLWMTLVFWCIDIFLFVFSINRIIKLSAKRNRS